MESMSTDGHRRLRHFIERGRVSPPECHPCRVTNDVSDIRGAQTLLKNYVYVKKPHFYAPNDIKGSSSMVLHPTNRRIGNDDRFKQLPIEGSTSRSSGFRTSRILNPLEPKYQLPSFIKAPPIEPKFLRDSFNVSDIEGTSMKKHTTQHPRDGLKLDDIPGAQSGWVPRHKRGQRERLPRDLLNVADITNVDFKSSRVTNVLNPVYTINGMTFQDDPLSRPLPQHPKREKPSYCLKTDDIQGANCTDPATAVVAGIVMAHRRNFRDTNATLDIGGAQADSRAHSILRSDRHVDPNVPLYVALDGTRVDASAISVGKSIVFADFVQSQELLEAARCQPIGEEKPYVVSGVGNVGQGNATKAIPQRPKTKKTIKTVNPPDSTVKRSNLIAMPTSLTRFAPLSSKFSSKTEENTRSERRQAQARQEDIQLVRELN